MLYILCFTLPLIVAAIVVEAAVRHLPSTYKLKHAAMVQDSVPPTIVLGNSHGYYDINPSCLSTDAFNLANVSQTLDYDAALLEQLDGDGGCVVLTVDNSNLFDPPLWESSEWYRCRYYHLYMDCEPPAYTPGYLLEIADVPTTRLKVAVYRHHKPLGCDSLGWGNTYAALASGDHNAALTDSAAVSRNRAHTLRQEADLHRNLSHLQRIIAICSQRHARLVIVSPPVSESYRRYIPQRQRQILDSVVATLPSAVEYRDYASDPRFGDSDFYDSDHLNTRGANRFSKLLSSDFGL